MGHSLFRSSGYARCSRGQTNMAYLTHLAGLRLTGSIYLHGLGIQDPLFIIKPKPDSAYYSGYGRYQQDVLLPAFLAAYAGKNPYQVGLSPFFNIPLPNWKITFTGLTKIKFFQNLFSSFSLSNGYTCTYSIGSFSNSLNFSGGPLSDGTYVPTYIDPTSGSFVSFYQIPMVMVSEQLAPLIGLDMTWKNSLITKFEYDFSRTLGFSFLNNQLAGNKNRTNNSRAWLQVETFPYSI